MNFVGHGRSQPIGQDVLMKNIDPSQVVDAINELTSAWAVKMSAEQNTVFSGLGAWAVMAALLTGANGDARVELEVACGISQADAADAVEILLTLLTEIGGVSGGIGLWTHAAAPVRPEYAAALLGATVEPIPYYLAELDEWTHQQTGGLISKFPSLVDFETRMVVACPIVAQAKWIEPFTPTMWHWNGDSVWWAYLNRNSTDLDEVSIATTEAGSISRAVCRTTGGFDLHLLSGPHEMSAADVLHIGIEAAAGSAVITPGSELKDGESVGCLKVAYGGSFLVGSQVTIGLPVFNVEAAHDLLEFAELFGFSSAMDKSSGHFNGISEAPLAVQTAFQTATASFAAEGFEAAAVSVVTLVAGGGYPHEALTANMFLDRPFGYFAVGRDSSMVLFGGWVAEPTERWRPEVD
jgi:serine protease inhibitor